MKKKQLTYVALVSGLLLHTGCAQREFIPEIESNEAIELQISPRVSLTRSVIQSGTQNGGSGQMTNIAVCASGNDYTDARKNNDYALYTWKLDNINNTWQSGADHKIYLTGEEATIYAYYPAYKPGNDHEYATTDALKPTNSAIPVTVYEGTATEATYTIDCTTNNADKVWSINKWENNTNAGLRNSAPGEVDYMWATAVNKVSNKNGNNVTLNMNHALSLLTFRVYNNGTYTGTGALAQVKLEDAKNSATRLYKTPAADCTMNITTGAITGMSDADSDDNDATFIRAISNYTLVTQGAVDGETTPTDAAAASKKFSILVFPATDIANGDVKATFTIDGTTYSVNLDAPTGTVTIGGNSVDTAGKWLAGVNYQYTVRLSGTGLSISTISVTDWVDAPNGSDMDIQ